MQHIKPYINACGGSVNTWIDKPYNVFGWLMGQLIVVMFLFYSGYGVMRSIQIKGMDYVRDIPKHRILNVLLNFDVAVLLFLITNLILDNDLDTKQVFLSFIGWDAIGNSNWYIFCILYCYFATWIAFTTYKSKKNGMFFLLLLTAIYFAVVSMFKPSHWSNTVFCFTFGAAFGLYEENFSRTIKNHAKLIGLLSLLACIMFTFIEITKEKDNGLLFNIHSICFVLIVVLITTYVKIGNPILQWLGSNLFPLYIYQRIPMMIVANKYETLCASHPYLYIVLCFLLTIPLVLLYQKIQIRIK